MGAPDSRRRRHGGHGRPVVLARRQFHHLIVVRVGDVDVARCIHRHSFGAIQTGNRQRDPVTMSLRRIPWAPDLSAAARIRPRIHQGPAPAPAVVPEAAPVQAAVSVVRGSATGPLAVAARVATQAARTAAMVRAQAAPVATRGALPVTTAPARSGASLVEVAPVRGGVVRQARRQGPAPAVRQAVAAGRCGTLHRRRSGSPSAGVASDRVVLHERGIGVRPPPGRRSGRIVATTTPTTPSTAA